MCVCVFTASLLGPESGSSCGDWDRRRGVTGIAQRLLLVTDFDLGSHRWAPSASESGNGNCNKLCLPCSLNRRQFSSEEFRGDTGVLLII